MEKPEGLHEANIALLLAAERIILNRTQGDRFIFTGADSTLRMKTLGRIRPPDVCAFFRGRLPGGEMLPEFELKVSILFKDLPTPG